MGVMGNGSGPGIRTVPPVGPWRTAAERWGHPVVRQCPGRQCPMAVYEVNSLRLLLVCSSGALHFGGATRFVRETLPGYFRGQTIPGSGESSLSDRWQ